MDVLKKISPPWAAVAILIVVVLALLFRQRRSGYTPAAGTPISLMDLQEFSAFTPEQKTKYMQMISESSAQLMQAASSKSYDAFIATISNILRQVIQLTPTAMVQPSPTDMVQPSPTAMVQPSPTVMVQPPPTVMVPPPSM